MRQLKLVCAAIAVMGVGSGALAQNNPLTLRMVCRPAVAEHVGARCPILSHATMRSDNQRLGLGSRSGGISTMISRMSG
jgi:hypothetical protein